MQMDVIKINVRMYRYYNITELLKRIIIIIIIIINITCLHHEA